MVEVVALERSTDGELEEWHLAIDQRAHGFGAFGDPKVARIHATRLDRDEGLRDEALVLAERTLRCLLARGIPVEREHDLAAEDALVHEQPPQHRDVIRPERRATRRDRSRDTGQVRGHHVGVALDDHCLLGARDVLAREVDAVEHLALLVERRLRGVEVFRPVVVLAQATRAESHDIAGEVADRPHEAPAEAVVGTTLTLHGEAGLHQDLLGEPLLLQVVRQAVPAQRGEADAEVRGGVGVKPALGEERAADRRIRCLQELDVERRRKLVGLDQASAVSGRGPRRTGG